MYIFEGANKIYLNNSDLVMHGALKNLLRPHASNQKPKFYLHFGPGWFWG